MRFFSYVFVLACGCGGVTVADESTRPPSGLVTIDDATRIPIDAHGHSIRLHVTNGTSAPVYVYTRQLGEDFDADASWLRLVMHEVPTVPPPNGEVLSCDMVDPSYEEVAAGASVAIDLNVDTSHRDVSHLDVELGWSDRPIVLTPAQRNLCNADEQKAFMQLERGVAIGSFDLTP